MALIVEDGSVVAGANSYVARADYIAYAANIGITLDDSVATDYQLIKATEYVNMFEPNFVGLKTTRDQPLSFPRSGVYIDGWYWESDEIPTILQECVIMFALDINSGDDLYNRPNNPYQLVQKEKIEGAVEVEYAVYGMNKAAEKTSKADSLLRRLFKYSDFGQFVQAVRY